jgi:predicted amidohydrolase YtcJ
VNNAWAEGQEDNKGKIEPGMLADIVILSDNLFSISAAEIKGVNVNITITGGRIIYERE